MRQQNVLIFKQHTRNRRLLLFFVRAAVLRCSGVSEGRQRLCFSFNTSSIRVLDIIIITVTSPSVTSKTTLKPCFFFGAPPGAFPDFLFPSKAGYYLQGRLYFYITADLRGPGTILKAVEAVRLKGKKPFFILE